MIKPFTITSPGMPELTNNDLAALISAGQMQSDNEAQGIKVGIDKIQKDINSRVGELQHGICVANKNLQAISQQVDRVTRKARRKLSGSRLAVLQDGQIYRVDFYDDGDQAVNPFFSNVVGRWNVYRVQMEDGSQNLFCINFPACSLWLVGEVKKVSGRYLYERFIENGIVFAPNVTNSLICRLLFETFAPLILRTTDVVKVVARPGWQNGVYWHAGNFAQIELRDFVELPVMRNRLLQKTLSAEQARQYFEKMRCISDLKIRVPIMLYPFMGVLGSLLLDAGVRISFYLNFIRLNSLPAEGICGCFQVLNRERLLTFNPDITQQEMDKKIASLGDEVLIADFATPGMVSEYKQRKMADSIRHVGNVMTGRSNLPGTDHMIQTALVAVSAGYVEERNVMNIPLTKDMNEIFRYWQTEEAKDIMTAVISEFVEFVQKTVRTGKMPWLKQIQNVNEKFACLRYTLDVVVQFWKIFDIDFCREAGILQDCSMDEMFADEEYGLPDLLSGFVEVMRRQAHGIKFEDRNCAMAWGDHTVFVDDDWLYVTPDLIAEIIDANGLKRQLSQILLELKKEGFLLTDCDGLTKKIQIGGDRRHVYVIRREAFNRPGLIDIVDLGR